MHPEPVLLQGRDAASISAGSVLPFAVALFHAQHSHPGLLYFGTGQFHWEQA